MKKALFSLSLLASLSCFTVQATKTFGYISYSTYNKGDYIQALAALNLLPEDSIGIDRDFIYYFQYPLTLPTLVNGWFLQTKNTWSRPNISAPQNSWPPSPAIDPYFISIHLTPEFLPLAFSPEGLEYWKKHCPIGTRDLFTLNEFNKRNIPAYFSGCLTLTLEYPHVKKNNTIILSDLDNDCIEYIKARTNSPVYVVTHNLPSPEICMTWEQKLQSAKELLDLYRHAKAVITTRLHAALPCLALGTPVLFICDPSDPRFGGLRELTNNCSREEFLNGMCTFDFNTPKKNSNKYLKLRKKLIKNVSSWVKENNTQKNPFQEKSIHKKVLDTLLSE